MDVEVAKMVKKAAISHEKGFLRNLFLIGKEGQIEFRDKFEKICENWSYRLDNQFSTINNVTQPSEIRKDTSSLGNLQGTSDIGSGTHKTDRPTTINFLGISFSQNTILISTKNTDSDFTALLHVSAKYSFGS